MTWPSSGWFPIECGEELARDIREHNARVARDMADATARRNAVLLASQSFLDVVASTPAKAFDESDAEFRRRLSELTRQEAASHGCGNAYVISAEVVEPVATDTKLAPLLCWIDVGNMTGCVYSTAADVVREGILVHVEANSAVQSGDMLAFIDGMKSPVVTICGTVTTQLDAVNEAMGPYDPAGYSAASPPRATSTREDERRAIDALLREDAQRTPAFATARRAAVLAYAESAPEMSRATAGDVLTACAGYEAIRYGAKAPCMQAIEYVDTWRGEDDPMVEALGHYERTRGMR